MYIVSLEVVRRLIHNGFELSIEVGHIIIATIKANLGNGLFGRHQ